MRALRAVLTGVLSLAMLACSAIGVDAQEVETEPDELSAPHIATAMFAWGGLDESGERSEDGLSVRGEGWMGSLYSPEDPRLSGATRIVRNVHKFESLLGARQLSGAIRIENDGGAWTGTLRGYLDPETQPSWHLNIELTGEGGYSGHAAVFTTPGQGDGLWKGYVFPSSLPAYPDSIEPFGE